MMKKNRTYTLTTFESKKLIKLVNDLCSKTRPTIKLAARVDNARKILSEPVQTEHEIFRIMKLFDDLFARIEKPTVKLSSRYLNNIKMLDKEEEAA